MASFNAVYAVQGSMRGDRPSAHPRLIAETKLRNQISVNTSSLRVVQTIFYASLSETIQRGSTTTATTPSPSTATPSYEC